MIMNEIFILNFIYIMFFLLFGFFAAFFPFIFAWLIKPRTARSRKKFETYECGMETFGDAWDFRYGVAYYLYALIFLAFDVDILYLFPVATAFKEVSAWRGVIEIFIFVGVLTLAIVYAWVKGVFRWDRKTKSF